MAYSRARRHWPWKPYLLGVFTLPALYLGTYLALRLCGVYSPFYNQGGWEIEGRTHVRVLDLALFPVTVFEADVQNKLRLLREPTGG